MPFAWYYPKRVNTGQSRADSAVQEVAARAAVMQRLGYDQDTVVRRLHANLDWDFEIGAGKGPQDKVETIVAAVFQRRGVGGGGAPSV